MAYLQQNDVQQLWYETPAQNWTALRKTLEYQKTMSDYDGIDDELVERLLKATRYMENSGEPYPTSPTELYSLLYQQV